MRTVSRTDYLTAVSRLAECAGAEPDKVAGIECFRDYYSVRFMDASGDWTTSIVHVIDIDDGRCICPSANDPEGTGPDEDCPHHGRDATETFAGKGRAETGFKPGSLADQMLRDPDGYWNRVMEKAQADAGESSRATAWPDVDVDECGQIACPIGECGEPLYLNTTYSEPLYAEQDSDTGTPGNATTSRWEVACVSGHVLWTSVDQARVRGGDPTDPDEPYDHMQVHKIINKMRGKE